jgi:hypothetical protein
MLKNQALKHLKWRLRLFNMGFRFKWSSKDQAAISKLYKLFIIHQVIDTAENIYKELSPESQALAREYLQKLDDEEKKHA